MFLSSVECYDCHRVVRDLRAHRRECANPRRPGQAKHAAHPVQGRECYDCHVIVPDLKAHRAACKAGVKVNPKQQQPQKNDGKDVFMLIDVSGSMVGGRLESAKAAVLKAHTEVLADEDRLAVITFDDAAFFKLKPRPNRQLKAQGEIVPLMDRIFAKGMTALYDAIAMALDAVHDKQGRRTEIHVLTDGADNSSTATLEEVLAKASEYPLVTVNIVHVADAALSPYEQLAKAYRGRYILVKEMVEITQTFVKMVKM